METAQAAPCYQYDVEDCIPSDAIDISPLMKMVNDLAAQAVTTANRCVNGSEPVCAQAKKIALDAVALAQAAAKQCLNDSYGTCQTTVATVVALANSAVDLALGCVSQDVPACRTAFDTANQGVDTALEQADACLNDYYSACQSARRTAEQTADILVQLVMAAADACLTDSSSVCQTTINLVYTTALQQAAAVQAAARDCLQDDGSLCQRAAQLAVDTGLGAVATATDLASWCLEDGGSVCQTTLSTAMQLVVDTQKLAQDTAQECRYDDSSLCQVALAAAQALAASAQSTAWACVNETNPTCKTALTAARGVVSEAGQCGQELIPQLATSTSTEPFVGPTTLTAAADDYDISDTCRLVNETAMAAVKLALDTAVECVNQSDDTCSGLVQSVNLMVDQLYKTLQACAAETNQTCKTVLTAARGVVSEAGQCGQELIPQLATSTSTEPFVGPTTLTAAADDYDISDTCRLVNETAMAAVKLALDIAVECVNQTDDTCSGLVVAVEELVDELTAAAMSCVNEWNATCKLALETARASVDEAGQCITRLSAPAGTTSPTDDGAVGDTCVAAATLALELATLAVAVVEECSGTDATRCAPAPDPGTLPDLSEGDSTEGDTQPERQRAGVGFWAPTSGSFSSGERMEAKVGSRSLEWRFSWSDATHMHETRARPDRSFKMKAQVQADYAGEVDRSEDGYFIHNLPNRAVPMIDIMIFDSESRKGFGIGAQRSTYLNFGTSYFAQLDTLGNPAAVPSNIQVQARAAHVDEAFCTGMSYITTRTGGGAVEPSSCVFSDYSLDVLRAREMPTNAARQWSSNLLQNAGLDGRIPQWEVVRGDTHGGAFHGTGAVALYPDDPTSARAEIRQKVAFNVQAGDNYTVEAVLRCRNTASACHAALSYRGEGSGTTYEEVSNNVRIPNDGKWYACKLDLRHEGQQPLTSAHPLLTAAVTAWPGYGPSGGTYAVDVDYITLARPTEYITGRANGNHSGLGSVTGGTGVTRLRRVGVRSAVWG